MMYSDPTRNILYLPTTVWPQYQWCQRNWNSFKFFKFESTWVSVTIKGIK